MNFSPGTVIDTSDWRPIGQDARNVVQFELNLSNAHIYINAKFIPVERAENSIVKSETVQPLCQFIQN